MISLSTAFRQALYNNDRSYDISADITLLGGKGTALHLTNEHIWSGGVSFDDAVSSDDNFDALGSTVINTAHLTINNNDETYSSYDFSDAKVVVYVSKTFGSTTEKIKKGTYYVDEAIYSGGLISLSCVDMMAEFEHPYSTSTLTYPATLGEIVREACSRCDVTLQTYTFPHSDYSVGTKPDTDSLTYREVIGWCAAIAGCFARCNRDGELEIKWFDQETLEDKSTDWDGGVFKPWLTAAAVDGGSFNPWADGTEYDGGTFAEEKAVHYITSVYQEHISMDDVVLTRVKIIVEHDNEETGSEEKTYTCGSEGYTVEIRDNPFITVDTAQQVCDWLGAQLNGLTFRKASVSHANTPAIEAGDIGVVWDRKGREYPILITRTAFAPYGQQQTVSGAQTPKRNSAARYSTRSKAYVDARKLVKREMTDRERELEKLADKLAAHSGLYATVEVQSDGSSIYYLHDMPNRGDSQIIWKMTKEAWGVSTDGGKHWNAGMTVDGDTIVRILTATGINADWITSGALSVVKNKGTSSAFESFYANASNGTVRMTGKDTSGNETFYLNSATGEFRLSASKVKVGDKTLAAYISDNASMTKEQIFNKLTDNGATQGIYLKDGKLYLNATYMATGVLADTSKNTTFDLSTGTLTMKKGSINLGDYFSVNSYGRLACTNANVSGTLTGGTYGDGYWFRLTSGGALTGGYNNSTYGTIDTSARQGIIGSGTYNGLRISGGILDLNVTRITSRWTATATSTSTSFISRIDDLGGGSIQWWTSSMSFENGLMTTSY